MSDLRRADARSSVFRLILSLSRCWNEARGACRARSGHIQPAGAVSASAHARPSKPAGALANGASRRCTTRPEYQSEAAAGAARCLQLKPGQGVEPLSKPQRAAPAPAVPLLPHARRSKSKEGGGASRRPGARASRAVSSVVGGRRSYWYLAVATELGDRISRIPECRMRLQSHNY
eukprot:scaffold2851_cov114-Isochrysis_galbana.AAC.4